ncbi:MAG: decarboxylating NADP(+)-dependent phosphogluconate dehydrogenase [Balneolaceae bacterium]|nr:decarboxylating NADP(+)-dependent phosphogluconate dehydrogenase [Balneolaceae bacterium]
MNSLQIGIYGLGVMGRNLALNLEDNGFSVSVFNRKAPGEETIVQDFMKAEGQDKNFYGADSLVGFIQSLESPRKILLMVKAGKPVDQVLESLIPHLDKGDIIIDGGNSYYRDTIRRINKLQSDGVQFVGMGVSGGEQGARFGPSLMPGGSHEAWPEIKPFFENIAAKAFDGTPCCRWVGEGGAGHFVKMVHNGIEYADMQLLAEVYHILKESLGMQAAEIGRLFKLWNETSLNSYLMEITSKIFMATDDDGEPLVEKILDCAAQKGTGRWTAIEALQHNVALPGISQAVFARFFSNLVEIRNEFSETQNSISAASFNREELIENLEKTLLACRLTAYAEGFFMISSVSDEFEWDINYSSIAKIWQGGCIIRSVLLKEIEQVFQKKPNLKHLYLFDDFSEQLSELQSGWRSVVSHAINSGIPVPCMSAYMSLYDTLRSNTLPANLIQAQRDFFGAHTYERIDKPRGQFFHTDWENQ